MRIFPDRRRRTPARGCAMAPLYAALLALAVVLSFLFVSGALAGGSL